MRLSFPNGEHTDVALSNGELSIGSAAGNAVMLAQEGVLPRHARVRFDPQRGILLDVDAANAGVFVNGREVQQFALLRQGDVVSVGRVQMLIKPDRDEMIIKTVPEQVVTPGDDALRAASSRVVLRGVAGSFFGRSISLRDTVVVGSSAEANLRIEDDEIPAQAVSFEIVGDRVILRDLGTLDGAVVNGVPVRNAVLHPGDQIAIDVHRFVLEAPGLPARGKVDDEVVQPGAHAGSTQTLRAVKVDPPTPRPPVSEQQSSDDASASGARWGWLLLAAVAVAAALTALFLRGPG